MLLLIAAENVLVGMMDILLVVLALDVLLMSDAGVGILNSAIGVGGLWAPSSRSCSSDGPGWADRSCWRRSARDPRSRSPD